MAHDFRTPMVNMKGFSQELTDSLADLNQIIQEETLHLPEKLKARVAEILGKDVPEELYFIHSSVDRLDRMIDSLLLLGSSHTVRCSIRK